MSRIVIVILIYHHHNPIDHKDFWLGGVYLPFVPSLGPVDGTYVLCWQNWRSFRLKPYSVGVNLRRSGPT
jgi:hypothetical protein